MKSVKSQMRAPSFKSKNLNKSAGILDDFAVRKVISTKEGTITKTPVNDYDIVNKKYVDENAGNEYTAGTGLTLTELEFSTNDIEIDHNELLNYVANEHIDWTNATNNLLTTGTLKSSNFETTSYGVRVGTNTGEIGLSNLFFGKEAGLRCTNDRETFIGNGAGKQLSSSYTGSRCTFVGNIAGAYSKYNAHVVAVGYSAGYSSEKDDLTAIGYESGKYSKGEDCSFFGSGTGYNNTGYRSIGIGFESAKENDGDNCVFIGHRAGKENTTNNQFSLKHSIANATPLIKGDFSTGNVDIQSLDIGGTTNYTEIKDDGEINLHGTARVKKCFYIDADGIKAPGAKPASFIESGLSGSWEFSDEIEANQQTISGNVKIPNDADRTIAPTLNIGIYANGVSPGNTKFQLEYLYRGANDNMTASAQETLTATATASATSNGLIILTFTGIDLPSSTDKALIWKLKRLSADEEDTISAAVFLKGMFIEYTSDKLGEAI